MAEWCFKIGSLHSVKEKQQKKKSLKMLCIYKENKFCQNDQGYLLPLRVFNLNIHNMQGDDNL